MGEEGGVGLYGQGAKGFRIWESELQITYGDFLSRGLAAAAHGFYRS